MRKNKKTLNFRGEKMRKFSLSLLVSLCMVALAASVAFAAHSGTEGHNQLGQAYWLGHTGVTPGNDPSTVPTSCNYCHESQTKHTSGPHGGYTTTSNKCQTCHGLHAQATGSNKAWNNLLLPGTTTVEVCNYCHDLTQTDLAPYYTNYMTTEASVKSAHKVAGLTVASDVYGWEAGDGTGDTAYTGTWDGDPTIPGGDYSNGGDHTLTTAGQGKLSQNLFTCDSCHTPHAITGATVDPYVGESHIKISAVTSATFTVTLSNSTTVNLDKATYNPIRLYVTDRLLKASLQDPNKSRSVGDMVYTKYNSNWCAGCHMGRYASDPDTGVDTMHNHPVAMGNGNSKADGYQFLDIADAAGDFVNGWNPASLIADAKAGKAAGTAKQYYILNYPNAVSVSGSAVVLKSDPRTNKQYAMTGTDPITGLPRPDGNLNITDYPQGPSCQQCHGSARNVELAFMGAGGESNVEAMTFPHVSENQYLLVENNDDFCTNCHGLDNLP